MADVELYALTSEQFVAAHTQLAKVRDRGDERPRQRQLPCASTRSVHGSPTSWFGRPQQHPMP